MSAQSKNKRYYFAYGSNLSSAQVARRCPGAVPFRVGVLYDYALCFPRRGCERWNLAGVASIEPRQGAITEGVLYEMTEEHFLQMDHYEDLHRDWYYRHDVEIEVDGKYVVATTYIANPEEEGAYLPSLKYIDVIIGGARKSGLSDAYMKTLENIRNQVV